MGIKKAVAATLSAAMLLGFTGCDAFGVRKGMGVMHGRLTNFNEALNKLDYVAAREQTDWTEDDEDYAAIEQLFDTSYYGDVAGEGFVNCTEYIASTITMKFDVTSVNSYYYNATLDVTYEMVDWQSVYVVSHDNYDEVLEALKNCEDKITIESTVTFENVDEKVDWRICRINDLSEVMAFVYALPNIPAPAAEEGAERFDTAVGSYFYTLTNARAEIEKVENLFGIAACGTYDINSDGVPELYYVTEDREDKSGKFCICYYDESTGSTAEGLTVSNFISIEFAPKNYSVFMTDTELVIIHGYEDDQTFYYVADVYDFDLNPITSYYCAQQYEFDPSTGTEVLMAKYVKGGSVDMTAEEFLSEFNGITDRAQVVLLNNYRPFDNGTLENVPEVAASSCYDEIMYLKSLIDLENGEGE